jgi:hypothetical protein
MPNHIEPIQPAMSKEVAEEAAEALKNSPADRELAATVARLEAFIPNEPYVPDSALAKWLRMSQKTLANRRSLDPAKYPCPLKLGGARTGVHPRGEFITWIAREELAAKARVVHRCR